MDEDLLLDGGNPCRTPLYRRYTLPNLGTSGYYEHLFQRSQTSLLARRLEPLQEVGRYEGGKEERPAMTVRSYRCKPTQAEPTGRRLSQRWCPAPRSTNCTCCSIR